MVSVRLSVRRRFRVLIDVVEPARTVGFGNPDSARTVGFGNPDSARTVGFGNPDSARTVGFGKRDSENGSRDSEKRAAR